MAYNISKLQKFIEALVQEQDRVSKSLKIISSLTSQLLSELNPSNEKLLPSANVVLHLRQKRFSLVTKQGQVIGSNLSRIKVANLLVNEIAPRKNLSVLKKSFSRTLFPGSYDIVISSEEYNNLTISDKGVRYRKVQNLSKDGYELYTWSGWSDEVTKNGIKISANFPILKDVAMDLGIEVIDIVD